MNNVFHGDINLETRNHKEIQFPKAITNKLVVQSFMKYEQYWQHMGGLNHCWYQWYRVRAYFSVNKTQTMATIGDRRLRPAGSPCSMTGSRQRTPSTVVGESPSRDQQSTQSQRNREREFDIVVVQAQGFRLCTYWDFYLYVSYPQRASL